MKAQTFFSTFILHFSNKVVNIYAKTLENRAKPTTPIQAGGK